MTPEVLSRRVDLTMTGVGVVAFGYLAALVAVPSGPDGPVLLALVAGALVVLAGAELIAGAPPRSVGLFALLYAVLAAISWGLLAVVDSFATVTLLLAGGVALLAYGLHRYELVALGLVGDVDEH
ncbi:hypothetical protein [Halorientalis regularis]|uniref:DUF8163 domain-containing protein n=1 Tax=Halorientalis regularis TaxID=660518 RepID=A0A1G7T3K0_9EURY|nr:hypothetical protein [Halorientalis regularis]SDG29239.1 hypothetical protein SAMN05216218_1226 [Halorientalis regularis]